MITGVIRGIGTVLNTRLVDLPRPTFSYSTVYAVGTYIGGCTILEVSAGILATTSVVVAIGSYLGNPTCKVIAKYAETAACYIGEPSCKIVTDFVSALGVVNSSPNVSEIDTHYLRGSDARALDVVDYNVTLLGNASNLETDG